MSDITSDRNNLSVWDIYAPVYDIFMKMNENAYRMMYRRIRRVIRGKTVLELAAGTGLVTKNTASAAADYTASDYSAEMLRQMKKGNLPPNVGLVRADAADLPFADGAYDAVIIANALHIVPEPEKVLTEIKRVLKPDGILIAPNFIHKDNTVSGNFLTGLLSAAGIVFETRWDRKGYAEFLRENGFSAEHTAVLRAAFPLDYTESHIL